LTYGCNISDWIKYKISNPTTKIVFELIDSYLLENNKLSILRGLTKYFTGKESSIWLDYKMALRNIISVADAVVCSTKTQMESMLHLNDNIHLSLDYFSNDIICNKSFLESSNKLKLVWEGQSHTVGNLLILNDVFEKLSDEIELYIITDPIIKNPFRIYNKKTKNKLKNLKCKYYLIDWNKDNFSQLIVKSDLAIIPIHSKNPMMWNKPENKLLLLWEVGIPTLTSDTPAYKQVMKAAGLEMYCKSSDEWVQKIKKYKLSSIEHRKSITEKANSYLAKYHNQEEILKKWDDIFNSLLKNSGNK
jgi:glycosyltransferase involved in cell wall biosynthesis